MPSFYYLKRFVYVARGTEEKDMREIHNKEFLWPIFIHHVSSPKSSRLIKN